MTKEKSLNLVIIFAGLLPIWNGLQYFLEGQAQHNSDLRNYAVVGQILFGLAIIGWGFFCHKNSGQRASK